LASCGSKQPQIDRTYEEGVEVVLNHLEPYRIPNEPSELVLEKEYVIDTESPGLLEAGLTDIYQFGADSRGFVYLTQHARKDGFVIFQFDGRGRFLKSFGRVGQGPGEIEWSSYFGISSRDDIFVLDTRRKKILTFAQSGELIRETLLPRLLTGGIPLENGTFFASESRDLPASDLAEISLNLFDRQFAKIKTFYRFQFPSQFERMEKVNVFYPNPTGTFTSDKIYLGIPGQKYEVLVYDLAGTLLRKIRKDYTPVPVTAGFQKDLLARVPKGNSIAERLYFPDHKPAFQYFFADEAGRLFVMTMEKDDGSGQNVCDIFNASGVFIARAAVGYYNILRTIWEGLSLEVVARNGRIYTLHEKEDGYKELVVYKAIWR
jgi:hypothetical protein